MKLNLSKQTLLMVGDALEMGIAHLTNADCWTGVDRCEQALTRLRRALRLPKDYSFTTERVALQNDGKKWKYPWHKRKRKTKR